MNPPALTLTDVTKRFGAHLALDNVSFGIAAGKVAVIVGPSGCGKTTLLRVIAGLEAPDTGEVVLNGNTVSTAGGTIVPPHERRLGFVFQDPTLKGLIQEALRNNYDVGIAAARVQEARANLRIARADRFPSLDYNATVGRARLPLGGLNLPDNTDHRTDDVFIGTMSMAWELDIWGRVRRSNEAARATLLATEDARRAVWLTLVSDLARAYFELLALDVQLQISRDSTQAYQSTYDIFLDRFNVGTASRLETSRALGALEKLGDLVVFRQDPGREAYDVVAAETPHDALV